MKFEHSKKTLNLIKKVSDFMEEHIYPAEEIYTSEMKAFRKSGNPWQVPCLLYTSPSPRDLYRSRMPSSA